MAELFAVTLNDENGVPYNIEVRSKEDLRYAMPTVIALHEPQASQLEAFMKMDEDEQHDIIIGTINSYTEDEFKENEIWIRILLSQMSRQQAENGLDGIAWLSDASRRVNPKSSALSQPFADKADALEKIGFAWLFLYDGEHDHFDDVKRYDKYWYNKYCREVMRNTRKGGSARNFRRKRIKRGNVKTAK